jgi:hypothetical protein
MFRLAQKAASVLTFGAIAYPPPRSKIPEDAHPLTMLWKQVKELNASSTSLTDAHREELRKKIDLVQPDLKNWLFGRIYHNSVNSQKGGPNWGDVHATDDLPTLTQSLREIACETFDRLQGDTRTQVLALIAKFGNHPETDLEWAGAHVKDDAEALIVALNQAGQLGRQ